MGEKSKKKEEQGNDNLTKQKNLKNRASRKNGKKFQPKMIRKKNLIKPKKIGKLGKNPKKITRK